MFFLMLIDIRKNRYGFSVPHSPACAVFHQPSEVDVLLSQRPPKGGLPPTVLMSYLDKTTPIDVKMQLEGLLSSSRPDHICATEEDAFASVIPRNATVSELEQIVDDTNKQLTDLKSSSNG